MISRGMVDELRYNDQGNEVTLIKRYAPSAARGSEPVDEAPLPHE